MKQRLLIALIIIFLLTITFIFAAKTGKLNYQGKLIENGILVNGTRNLQFKIYDALTAGNILWQSSEQELEVKHGVFNYTLGEHSTLPGDIFNNGKTYIELIVEGVVQSPRKELKNIPYSAFSGGVDWNSIENTPTNLMLEGENISLLNNDTNYITYYTETDLLFTAHISSQITDIGSLEIIKTTERAKINELSGKLDGFTGDATDLNYAATLKATEVTTTEFDYLNGVTSNVQNQINNSRSWDYDSGWFLANVNTIYTKPHSLNINIPQDILQIIVFWRSGSSDTKVVPITYACDDGSGLRIQYDVSNITVRSSVLFGYSLTGGYYRNGEIRILARKIS